MAKGTSYYKDHFFTFGQVHVCDIPLPRGGRLADYYVRVSIPKVLKEEYDHRTLFIDLFTRVHCPDHIQFAFEYTPDTFETRYYPKGVLFWIQVNEHGKITKGVVK
jgi:hypothetical protein